LASSLFFFPTATTKDRLIGEFLILNGFFIASTVKLVFHPRDLGVEEL